MLKQEIIKQYIATLKEDNELDYIFPLLLKQMGYRVLLTPKQSKGQSQYGRDVVAAKNVDGVDTLFLFELKGFSAKDITDRTLAARDGIIESLNASKNTKYRDASISGLSKCPRKYVFVHNGYAEANALLTLNDYVEENFPEGSFDRWDLDKLTILFSEYLFDETLLTDEESYRLFKKVLVLLDSEGDNFKNIVSLVDLQIKKIDRKKKESKRAVINLFATLRLIASMVYFYSKDCNNLLPAKFCIDTILVKTWAWILKGKKEKKTTIIKHFYSLVLLQVQIYEEYVNKILSVARLNKSMYGFESSDTEYIFYPLRCFDFLEDLTYFFFLTESIGRPTQKEIRNRLDTLRLVIEKNTACTMPLLDTHSIPIQMVFLYIYDRSKGNEEAVHFLGKYLMDVVINMTKRYQDKKIWPEMTGNRLALARSLYTKDDDYCCESSLLITVIFELIAYLNIPQLYTPLKKIVEESSVNLQIAFPITDEFDIEQTLFDRRLYDEMAVQTDIKLPDTLDEFHENYSKKYRSIAYRTDVAGFEFMRILAHKYYETDLFPDFLGRAYCVD
ncbi:hypothetical protein J5A54_09545 [Prevotella melaninogenica]|uniref:hypothetical protein n=1 Tax=Prevotella melaninogenica TaxID=28132 RepID=UPI001BAD3039|nr:hypothetical protein [Prevotella melaninogenica]QUB64665.1 hypothetical protein J5A54_09545 [Prevotella melaninogenica]